MENNNGEYFKKLKYKYEDNEIKNTNNEDNTFIYVYNTYVYNTFFLCS